MSLTVERLHEVLKYYPESGEFVWLIATSPASRAFRPAGSTRADGRKDISVDGKKYLAHRLAWLYVHKQWPQKAVDHINGDPQDNRISNLRLASMSENQQNRAVTATTGTTWHRCTGKWRAQIKTPGAKSQTHLGLFDTQAEAHQAYLKAKAEHHTFQPTPRSSNVPSARTTRRAVQTSRPTELTHKP